VSTTEGGGFDQRYRLRRHRRCQPRRPEEKHGGRVRRLGHSRDRRKRRRPSAGGAHDDRHSISAYGPGASQFAPSDNTEAFFEIMNAILGSYPVPTSF
jgi:hypothetical protein